MSHQGFIWTTILFLAATVGLIAVVVSHDARVDQNRQSPATSTPERKAATTTTTPGEDEANQSFRLDVKVTKTESFCSGRPPTPLEARKTRQPEPVTDKVIYIRSGDTNMFREDPVRQARTDEAGSFSVSLPAGTYCLVEAAKNQAPDPQTYDPGPAYTVDNACLRQEWKRCDQVVDLQTDKDATITYNEECPWDKACVECKDDPASCIPR